MLNFYKLFSGVTLKVAGGQQLQGFSVQLVPHQGGVKGKYIFLSNIEQFRKHHRSVIVLLQALLQWC